MIQRFEEQDSPGGVSSDGEGLGHHLLIHKNNGNSRLPTMPLDPS